MKIFPKSSSKWGLLMSVQTCYCHNKFPVLPAHYVYILHRRFMKNLKLLPLFLTIIMMFCCSVTTLAQIQLDRPKSEPPLENPFKMGVSRELIMETTNQVLRACSIPLDESLSKPREGKLVTKPLVFTRGVTTQTDLEYLAKMPSADVRNWTQGRYFLEITVSPIDGTRSQIFVNAHIQGRYADILTGNQWIEGQSNGRLEDEILRGLAGKILGIDLSIKKNTRRQILNCEYQ
jgi:hypothetical protein